LNFFFKEPEPAVLKNSIDFNTLVGTFCSIGGSTKLQNHFQNRTKKKKRKRMKGTKCFSQN
jgi:hypothetical protein